MDPLFLTISRPGHTGQSVLNAHYCDRLCDLCEIMFQGGGGKKKRKIGKGSEEKCNFMSRLIGLAALFSTHNNKQAYSFMGEG